MSRLSACQGLNAAHYQRHASHTEASDWSEKNCYVDVWIEMLHAFGLEPRAMLPFTLAIDFLGDQWTFYKPSHEDLYALYGIEVQELTVWRPLLDHAREHLAAGRLISTESDAFWLPDTAGTDYRTKHTKTTIALNLIDLEAKRVEYFHNAGYFYAVGEDFDRILGIQSSGSNDDSLPLFAELVLPHRLVARPADELRKLSLALVHRYIERRPKDNPIVRFQTRLLEDLPELHARGLDHYHAWAFATTRQLGSAMELAAQNLSWLAEDPAHAVLGQAAEAFALISTQCKKFILKGARMVMAKRPMSEGTMFDELATAWERGTAVINASR